MQSYGVYENKDVFIKRATDGLERPHETALVHPVRINISKFKVETDETFMVNSLG